MLTLAETFDQLRSYHRQAPFLFFNDNTFATIGRELSIALFSDLGPGRRRAVGSAVAHYIAGVLSREAMVEIVDTLSQSADLNPGDHVKTLRGTTRGVIVRKLEDGRLVWRADDSGVELTSLPESLVSDPKSPRQEFHPE